LKKFVILFFYFLIIVNLIFAYEMIIIPENEKVKAFWIDIYDVTNAEYCKFLNIKGNRKRKGALWLNINSSNCNIYYTDEKYKPKIGYENYPVVEVNWYGAKAYSKWIGKRIPNEYEWNNATKYGVVDYVYPWVGEHSIFNPNTSYNHLGFRCVKTFDETSKTEIEVALSDSNLLIEYNKTSSELKKASTNFSLFLSIPDFFIFVISLITIFKSFVKRNISGIIYGVWVAINALIMIIFCFLSDRTLSDPTFYFNRIFFIFMSISFIIGIIILIKTFRFYREIPSLDIIYYIILVFFLSVRLIAWIQILGIRGILLLFEIIKGY